MRAAEATRLGEEYYRRHAASLLQQYESVDFPSVHGDLVAVLAGKRGSALDVGCGSGRDASWLAGNGWRVVAIDASRAMLEGASRLHDGLGIVWLEDSLPTLEHAFALGQTFDLVLLSAVWMHLPAGLRPAATANIASLTRDHGLVHLTIRSGPADPDRGFFETDVATVIDGFQAHGLRLLSRSKDADVFERPNTFWEKVTFKKEASPIFVDVRS